MRVLEHEPLAPRTTFKVGGSARFLIEIEHDADIRDALAFAHERGLPLCILGGGSNMLIDDGEADAVFLHIAMGGIDFPQSGECVAGAGEAWDSVVARTVAEGLWGLENLSAIPGSVGGAVVQNAGAYGAELRDALVWVEAFDTKAKEPVRLVSSDCRFGYRSSRFKEEPQRFIILKAAFALSPNGSPNISYRDLRERFAGTSPSLSAVRDAVIAIRAGKFPDLREVGTAGSFFKNPVLPAAQARALTEAYPGLPVFPAEDSGTSKVSLAWLLDHALGLKGKTEGAVSTYEKQPLVIVAQKEVRAAEVRAFAKEIQARVHAALGIAIEPEVIIMHGATMTSEL